MSENNLTGKVTYDPRAIRQDTLDAMRGDIVVGLIEFITNSDDAYRKVKKIGKIEIEFKGLEKPFKYSIIVRDHARGLSAAELKDKFLTIGKENTDNSVANRGEEGTRGLFGRGAKDVAVFGKVKFETIHNNKFSALEIDGFTWDYKILALDEMVTTDKYLRLGLKEGESGFSAEVMVSETRSTTIPNSKKIVEYLSNHVALRGINENQTVIFNDLKANQSSILKPAKPKGELVIDKEVIVKGYEKKAWLKIWKLSDRQLGECDEYSLHGIIIRDKKTNFQNTFLDLKSRPEIGWFHGELLCEEIDDLNRQFDENESNRESVDIKIVEKNPMRLAKKSRDGLDKKHPYYRSLSIILNEELKPLMDEIANSEGSDKSVSEDLQKKLDEASKLLAQLLQETLDEEDLDGDFDGGPGPEDSEILLVPPHKIIEKGKSGYVTAWIPEENFDRSKVSLTFGDTANFELLTQSQNMIFEKHPTRKIMKATIQIKAINFGTTEIILNYGNDNIQSKIECTVSDPDPTLMINEIVFEKDTYYLSPLRKRTVKVFAPAEMHKDVLKVEISNSGLVVPKTTELRLAKSKGYCIGKIDVLPGKDEGNFVLSAIHNGSSVETNLVVKDINPNKGPTITIDPKNQDSVTRSSLIPLPGLLSIQIYLKHKGIRKLLGVYSNDKYTNIDSHVVKAVFSEIVASEIANYVIETDFAKRPHLYRDPSSLIRKQKELMTKFNVAMQSFLLADFI